MKIKLGELIREEGNFKLLQEVKLPVKISYRIKRLIDKSQPLLKSYEENRTDLVRELGEEDLKTKIFSVKKENEIEFFDKIKELQEIEEEIDFKPIKLSELGQISIEPKLMINWIFEE